MKKHRLDIVILLLITLAVFYFSLKDDFSNIFKTILNVNPFWLIGSVILIILSWLFAAMCLHTLAKNIEHHFNILDYFKSIIITNFFGSITPYAVGGQPFQIYYLNKHGMKLSNATNIIIEFFKIHQITLVLLGFFAVILNYRFDYFPHDNILKNIVLVGFVLNGSIAILLFLISKYNKIGEIFSKKIIKLLHKMKIIRDKERFFQKVDNYIHESNISSTYYNNHKRELLLAAFYNFISLCLLYLTPLFIGYSFNAFDNLNVLNTIVGSAYVMIIGALVPIPGGTGGLEFGFVHFFGFFLNGSILMASLLMWRFVTFYFGILIGGLVFLFSTKKRK